MKSRLKLGGSVATILTAAVLAAGQSAWGQVQANQNGTARDANTRVGSGGLNSRPNNLQLYSADDIAFNRVTGGRGFRGRLTGDPTQPFGGRGGLPSDRSLRAGNPPVSPAAPTLPAGTYAVPFYSGTTATSNVPSNFVLNSYTGQFVFQRPQSPGVEDIQANVPPGTPVIRPGAGGSAQLIFPASVQDGNGRVSTQVLTASPLLGVRPLPLLNDEDQFLLNRSQDFRRASEPPLDPAVMRTLRLEQQRTMLSQAQLEEQYRQANPQTGNTPAGQLPGGAQLPSGQIDARPGQAAQVTPGVVQAQVGGAPRATQIDPAQRNPLLAELRRMESDREAARTKTPKQPAAPSKSGIGGTGTPPKASGNPDTTTSRPSASDTLGMPPPPPGEVRDTVRPGKSLNVDSLAARQGNEAVKQLIQSAEELTAKGRFASAVDRYEMVRKYAPGDATVLVARMHAELGGGFFARAETSLRQAVATDPAVLNARYDLKKTLGEERLQTLVNDLKRLAVENKDESMAVLLLGYISYHGGDTERAAQLLNEASARAPGDQLPQELRLRWMSDDSNKP